MKKIKEKLTDMLNAMTFAEAGAYDAAIEYLDQNAQKLHARSPSETEIAQSVPTVVNKFVRRVEEHMVAATYAQAGEFDTAREMLLTRPKAVLLISIGHPTESDAFTYSVNLCKRIDAGMKILSFSQAIQSERIEEGSSKRQTAYERIANLSRLAEKHGVSCTISVKRGNLNENLFDYIRQHKEIAAVVYGAHSTFPGLGNEFNLQRALERIAERLSIPSVKVLRRRPVGSHP